MNLPAATSRVSTDHSTATIVRLRRSNTDWRVKRGWDDLFFDRDGLRLDYWIATGAATIVKTGPHRTVYRLELPAGGFYLKHYKIADWQARLQNLFRPCKAMLEYNAAVRVADAGIATVEPIAVGRVLTGPFVADSFLITPEIGPAVTLHNFILNIDRATPASELDVFRKQLARRLGELVGRLHRHGLIHRDLHAGNILLGLDPQAEIVRNKIVDAGVVTQPFLRFPRTALPRSIFLWLIDLHAVSAHRGVTVRKMECNLALLANFFSHFSTAADRRRFFGSYWRESRREERSTPTAAAMRSHSRRFAFDATLRRVENHCRQAVAEAHDAADRKWSRGNRRLIIADDRGIECRGVAEIGAADLKRIRDSPERLFSQESSLRWIVREENDRLAERTIEIGGQPVRVRIASQIRDEHDSKRARAAWETGHALARRGIDVLRPLLFIATPAKDGTRQEYLVNAHEEDAVPLREWLQNVAHSDAISGENRIRQAINRLADQIGKMHAAGFIHTRMTAENILIADEANQRVACGHADRPGASLTRTIFMGISAVQRVPRVSQSDMASMLRRLLQSLPVGALRMTHQLRLLKRLLRKETGFEWKPLWMEIALSTPARFSESCPNMETDTTTRMRQSSFTL